MMQQGDMVAAVWHWQDKCTIAVLSTNIQPITGSALRQTGRGKTQLYLFIMCIFFIADPHIVTGQLQVRVYYYYQKMKETTKDVFVFLQVNDS